MLYKDITAEYLISVGFKQYFRHQDMSINAIAEGMSSGLYEVKTELTNKEFKSKPYTKSGLPGYGSKYIDTYVYEVLYYRIRESVINNNPNLHGIDNPWYVGLKRKHVLSTKLVSNYCGD